MLIQFDLVRIGCRRDWTSAHLDILFSCPLDLLGIHVNTTQRMQFDDRGIALNADFVVCCLSWARLAGVELDSGPEHATWKKSVVAMCTTGANIFISAWSNDTPCPTLLALTGSCSGLYGFGGILHGWITLPSDLNQYTRAGLYARCCITTPPDKALS